MKPSTAAAFVSRALSFPSVAAFCAFLGAVGGGFSAPAHAQAPELARAVGAVGVDPWTAALLAFANSPAVQGAIVVGGGALLAWLIKTFFGVGIAAAAAALEASANVVEARYKASKDPGDDAPGSALAAALRAAATTLRNAEKGLPVGGKKGGVE